MPSEQWLSAFLLGLAVGVLAVSIPCRWWMNQSHRRSMEAYDRAKELLGEKFDLFREFHEGAMRQLRERKRP